MTCANLYANVILPLKLQRLMTYSIPEGMEDVACGVWVEVKLAGRNYYGVVRSVTDVKPDIELSKIRSLESIPDLPRIAEGDLKFWETIADYYMCSVGEVFKAAYPQAVRKQAEVKSRRKAAAPQPADFALLPALSPAQKAACDGIEAAFAGRKAALLHGVTGSGKTEIYMTLAASRLQKGRSVLMMVPEIAMSRQLQDRLAKVFGDMLIVFHSKLTAPQKKAALQKLAAGGPHIILGTRSSIFLPLGNVSLVIVDEEHDSSYKQDDPSPRYNGRDAAILLASQRHADVLLGSATPSFEAMYNVASGKYVQVDLLEKYHHALEPRIKVIDTCKARRLKDMKGTLSRELIQEIRRTLAAGDQVMVFRSRRAYATMAQCDACGDVPKCPHCNVSLSYHKYNNTLNCHYCGYSRPFDSACKACGSGTLVLRGSGTEKVEEELQACFPDAVVERFDAQTTESRTAEREILERFASGKTDILVGTQMITKGFDFEKLSTVAVVNADSLFSVQDFRADERALQLLQQLRGRAGRRDKPGRMFIQTDQPDHPVVRRLLGQMDEAGASSGSLAERRTFNYPPFVRLIVITVKDRSEGRLWHLERDLGAILRECGIADFNGPVKPAVDRVGDELISQFWVKLPRNRSLASTKCLLYEKITLLSLKYKSAPNIIVDVDPM